MTPALLLPMVLVGALVATFLVLILLGRPQGFVRITSTVAAIAVLALGVTTIGLLAGGATLL